MPRKATWLILSVAVVVAAWVTFYGAGSPVDAFAYWSAGNRPLAPYAPQPCCDYVYSPLFLQAGWPLWHLPFAVFVAALRAAELGVVVWFAGPVAAIALFLPPVATEINVANINLLIMAAVVGGFRWPVLWSFVLITKPTAGVGLLWFALRGEWRKAALPIGVAGIAALLSLYADPALWIGYIGVLARADQTPGWPFPWPLWVHWIPGVIFIIWGARTGRQWPMVVGTILAMPRLYFVSPAMLLAVLPTLRSAGSSRTA
jgi:hypothetical protein